MDKKDKRYALGLTFLFLAVGAFTASHHEMWRDEIQAWLLARDSTSIFNLFAHLKYEGHPGLWHLCLMPLSRIAHSPVMMQMLHLLITGVTVYLFVRYAPFNWFQKLLFCFGYLVLYEYAIVARNYALGLLLITVFCVLFKERYKRFIWVGCVLFLLAHTSVHALIVTIGIGIALCCEYAFGGRFLRPLNQESWGCRRIKDLSGSGLHLSVSVLLQRFCNSIHRQIQVLLLHGTLTLKSKRVNDIVKLISRAYLPVTRPVFGFWGSNLLTTYPFFLSIQVSLCYFLMLFSLLLFYKRPTALLIYLISTFGLLTFFYVKYHGSIRHHGFLFLAFLMCYWIYRDAPAIKSRQG